jgi:hypothetical protein
MGLLAPYSKQLVALARKFEGENQWIIFIGLLMCCPGASFFLWPNFSPGMVILVCGLRARLLFSYAVWMDIVSNDALCDPGGLGILVLVL